MRIKECGYSMITDEQGRKWLINKFYEMGCNKIDARTSTARFIKLDGTRSITVGHVPDVMLGMENRQELISIAEELGVVDWSKVAVDTPVLVSFDDKLWLCRYFADFKNGIVYTWGNGATPWSVNRRVHKDAWGYAKLAEV